eukprot:750733-Hanusia_phi.AAC.1
MSVVQNGLFHHHRHRLGQLAWTPQHALVYLHLHSTHTVTFPRPGNLPIRYRLLTVRRESGRGGGGRGSQRMGRYRKRVEAGEGWTMRNKEPRLP